jgi:DNA (cytosine-5)-methyltransferase 1
MRKLRTLDLFSGIGGFSLGLERTGGFETVAFCEIEPFPRKVLAKHWPGVPIYDDVRTLTADTLARDGIAVDVITGGFPCQDISLAGARKGLDGERSGLWSEIVRLARELRPQFIIVENVANLLAGPSDRPGAWFGRVLGDLAECGFDAEWENIPAAAVGAPHRRERVWIIAHTEKIAGGLLQGSEAIRLQGQPRGDDWRAWTDWDCEPAVRREDDGLSAISHRLAALGNAVVPQIPELIGRAILDARRNAA